LNSGQSGFEHLDGTAWQVDHPSGDVPAYPESNAMMPESHGVEHSDAR
jgi:hypothetical protein